MNPHYTQVALMAGHRCEYCHAPEAVFNLPLFMVLAVMIVPATDYPNRCIRPPASCEATRE